ncbi:MAG: hypothetical protein HDQ88_09870 [Clostridia bacterium]|nr:hypothetical protein [Clostridia bacterium]
MATLITNRYAAQLGSLTGVGPMAPLKGFTPSEKITATSLMEDYITEKSAKNVTNEELVRMSYVPLALAELVWDYAMTIVDMASNFQIPATKKLCLVIRKLRERYLIDEPRIFDDIIESKMKTLNAEYFDEAVSDIMQQFVNNVRFDLKSIYPDLDEEWVYYLVAVQQCHVLYSSLVNYVTSITGTISLNIGIELQSFLPAAFYRLEELIPCFMGDKPMSKSFDKLRGAYVKTFCGQMKQIKLLKDKKAV